MGRIRFKGMQLAGPIMAGVIALGMALDAHAQAPEPTLESAQAFLADVLTKGTSGVRFEEVQDGEPTGRWEWSRIVTVGGTGCSTHMSMSSKHGARSRDFDWSRVSSVIGFGSRPDMDGNDRYGISVLGAIRDSLGNVVSQTDVGVESYELGSRVVTAMTFLRGKCDSTAKYGF